MTNIHSQSIITSHFKRACVFQHGAWTPLFLLKECWTTFLCSLLSWKNVGNCSDNELILCTACPLLTARWSRHEMWKEKSNVLWTCTLEQQPWGGITQRNRPSKSKCNKIVRCLWQCRRTASDQRKHLYKHDHLSALKQISFQMSRWLDINLGKCLMSNNKNNCCNFHFLVLTFGQQVDQRDYRSFITSSSSPILSTFPPLLFCTSYS